MALVPGLPGASDVIDKVDMRKTLAGLVVHDVNGNPRTGIFPHTTDPIVTERSDMAVDVAAFRGVTVRGGGTILMANDGVAQVTIGAAPGGGLLRYDVVYFRQNESSSPGSEGDDDPVFGVLAGTASGFPTVPDVSTIPGATELATVLVPSGVTGTDDVGVVITQTAKYTAAPGGIVICRDADDLDAWEPADGSYAHTLDDANMWLRRDGVWAVRSTPSHGEARRTTTQSIPNNSVTAVAFNEPGSLQDFAYSTEGLTALYAGTYLLNVDLNFAANGSGYRNTWIKVNGVLADNFIDGSFLNNGSGHSTRVGGFGFIDLEAGDIVSVDVSQTSGGSLNLNANAKLRMVRISEIPLFL